MRKIRLRPSSKSSWRWSGDGSSPARPDASTWGADRGPGDRLRFIRSRYGHRRSCRFEACGRVSATIGRAEGVAALVHAATRSCRASATSSSTIASPIRSAGTISRRAQVQRRPVVTKGERTLIAAAASGGYQTTGGLFPSRFQRQHHDTASRLSGPAKSTRPIGAGAARRWIAPARRRVAAGTKRR